MSHLFIVNLAVSNLLTTLLYVPFDVEKNLKGEYQSEQLFLYVPFDVENNLGVSISQKSIRNESIFAWILFRNHAFFLIFSF